MLVVKQCCWYITSKIAIYCKLQYAYRIGQQSGIRCKHLHATCKHFWFQCRAQKQMTFATQMFVVMSHFNRSATAIAIQNTCRQKFAHKLKLVFLRPTSPELYRQKYAAKKYKPAEKLNFFGRRPAHPP